jgi:hypothetical protein
MLALLVLLVVLVMGHLVILAASGLSRFGHLGALQICANAWGLCDDPWWVGTIAVLLLTSILWLRRPSLMMRRQSNDTPPNATLKGGGEVLRAKKPEPRAPGQLGIRPRPTAKLPATCDHDDFEIIEGDRVVGRIYRLHSAERPWLWGILPDQVPPGRRAIGRANSYEDAKAAFWTAWRSR